MNSGGKYLIAGAMVVLGSAFMEAIVGAPRICRAWTAEERQQKLDHYVESATRFFQGDWLENADGISRDEFYRKVVTDDVEQPIFVVYEVVQGGILIGHDGGDREFQTPDDTFYYLPLD